MSERLRPPRTAPAPEWAKPDVVFNLNRLPPLPPVADAKLLEQALTHKTSLSQSDLADPDPVVRERVDHESNRRLEWAGDALFTWLVTEELFVRFPFATAGDLSILRQCLVSNRTISHLAWAYEFGSALRCSHDNSRTRTGLVHQKIFADAFEAYLSAAAHADPTATSFDTLRSYIRQLLGPDCVEGLDFAAEELRTRRLQGETDPMSPDQQVASLERPRPGESDNSGSPASARSEQPTSPDMMAWRDRAVHNGWLSSILVDDRVMATGHASKRVESRQRANEQSACPPERALANTRLLVERCGIYGGAQIGDPEAEWARLIPLHFAPFIFPIWAPEVARATGTSSAHLQLVATAAILGEYASAALFGALADRRGPGAVSTTAGILFGVGLGALAWRYQVCAVEQANGSTPWAHEWVLLALAWFTVGCGTAASYFSAMCSLSKSAPASHAGLAIALPCAVFGLSPLFLSTIASFFTTSIVASEESSALDVRAYLGFLGALLMAVNLAGGFLIRDLPWANDNIDRAIVAVIEPFPDYDDGSGYASPAEIANERTPLVRNPNGELDKPDEGATGEPFRAFVSTTSFWLLGGVVFFATGPAEMYMASVSQILTSLARPDQSLPSRRGLQHGTLTLSKHHVALLSITNTIWRLVVGAASDYLARPDAAGRKRTGWRKHIRLVFVGAACILLALACLWATIGMSSPAGLWIVTPAIAISYGTMFTLVPALVRARWNILDFGRNWGTLTWFSAAGAMLYTPLYGVLLDLARARQDDPENRDGTCTGPRCYRPIFALLTVSAVVAGALVVVLGRRWACRRIVV